jgi:ABC-type lipoprotein release transport system permease subunit
VAAHASNAFVGADPSQFRAIASLPQVESAAALSRLLMADSVSAAKGLEASTLAFMDDSIRSAEKPILTAGRLFDPDKADEALINYSAAREGNFHLGQRITLKGFTPDQLNAALSGQQLVPKGPTATVTVVGVIKIATDLTTVKPPRGVIYTGNDNLFMTPAFYKQVGVHVAQFPGLTLQLKGGDKEAKAFEQQVAALTHGQAFVGLGGDDLQAAAEAQRATHTEAVALWLFTILAGLSAVLVIGQSISRQIFLGSRDNSALGAIGMTRGQLTLVSLLQVAMAGALGAAVAAAAAVLLSPLAPIGLAREAEVDIGFHLDLFVVLVGAGAAIALFLARAALPAWIAGRTSGERAGEHHVRAADALARAGLPAPSVAGVRMALDPGRGRNAVPVRTAIAGSVLATAVLITAVAFGSSLGHLAHASALQGWTWDYAVGNPHASDDQARGTAALRANSLVAGFTAETFGGVSLDGKEKITALGLDKVSGDVAPPVLEGRAPEQPGEIALGTKALRALKKRIGDQVSVASEDGAHALEMRIVGRAVIDPAIVNAQISLGDGAVMSLADLRRFVPPAEEDEGAVNVFLVKLAVGADRRAAEASLQRDFPHTVLTAYAPAEVENLTRIGNLPAVLAGMLGLLAIATIAHALVTSVRRRRHDLAILKTLGFVRAQVRATVAWQASTLSLIASVIGLIGGAVAGRWLWIFYAERLGVRAEPALPLALLIVVIPAALAMANVIAAFPARAAARTEPALVLRTE